MKGQWQTGSALVLFKFNSVFGYDDEDNIGRDVEEEDDDTKYDWLLLCAVFFPHQSLVEVGPAVI